jgi:hypothetical protein
MGLHIANLAKSIQYPKDRKYKTSEATRHNVLMHFAWRASDEDGHAYISLSMLERSTRFDRMTILRALTDLQQIGCLRKTGTSSSQGTPIYEVKVPV